MSLARMAAKHVAAEIADALGKARLVGRELEIGAIVADQFVDRLQAKHAVDDDDIARIGLGFVHDEIAQVFRHRGLDLQAHDIAQAALLQRRLVLTHEVFGLFLDFDVAVA